MWGYVSLHAKIASNLLNATKFRAHFSFVIVNNQKYVLKIYLQKQLIWLASVVTYLLPWSHFPGGE
jgi:hypothetical protein